MRWQLNLSKEEKLSKTLMLYNSKLFGFECFDLSLSDKH